MLSIIVAWYFSHSFTPSIYLHFNSVVYKQYLAGFNISSNVPFSLTGLYSLFSFINTTDILGLISKTLFDYAYLNLSLCFSTLE